MRFFKRKDQAAVIWDAKQDRTLAEFVKVFARDLKSYIYVFDTVDPKIIKHLSELGYYSEEVPDKRTPIKRKGADFEEVEEKTG
jgi:hypothetical protein